MRDSKTSFFRSQAAHKRLHAKYLAESKKMDHNSRDWLNPYHLACYHADVMTQQRVRGKVIGKEERKRFFVSWMKLNQD